MGDFDMNELVERFYVMNPETEDVLPTGEQLRNGMIVLIESAESKAGLEYAIEPVKLANARKTNRWCEVSELRIWPNSQITFIGIYADGVKCQRTAPVRDAWLVTIDSVPDAVTSDTEPLYVKEGIDKLATISDTLQTPEKFNDWYNTETAWCSSMPTSLKGVAKDFAYVPSFVETPLDFHWAKQRKLIDEHETRNLIHGPTVHRQNNVAWHDLDVDEQDDLIRWANKMSKSLNEDGYIEVEPTYEVQLRSGLRVGLDNLKILFPKEFGVVEEKKVAVKDQDRTASVNELWQRFTDAEKDELIGIHQVTEGQLDDDGEIILKSGAKISGWEFKKLFE